jgi:sugar O-acyltransferase (sialic acid O-acetyltransferase NeuD family)
MKKLAIIGASGHGKVIADIAAKNGYREIVFLDDDESINECGGYPVVGTSSDIEKLDADVIVGIGNSSIRKRMQEGLNEQNLVTLIHPDAVIADGVDIGKGTVVMAGTVINPGINIGKGCIINTCSSVDHDCNIGDYVHVSVGSHICGTVDVGDKVWIGAGAIVSNNVRICSSVTIGAGAVVINDIEEPGTYIGVPARRVKVKNISGGGIERSRLSKYIVLFSAYALHKRRAA